MKNLNTFTLTLLIIISISFCSCKSENKRLSLSEFQQEENSPYSGFKGTFSVSENGAANYEIPLLVTPGVAGMTPRVSVSYSSNNSTSVLGEGWALNGFSYISRTPNTVATDGFSQSINFTPDDKLSLDGSKLLKLKKNDTYGSAQSQYRTENDTFKKIIIEETEGEDLNGIKYFRVLSKDGIDRYYGTLVDEDIKNCDGIVKTNLADQEKNVPNLWLITLAKDKNNNWIKYDYEISENSYRPKKISYGAAGGKLIGEVSFSYHDKQKPWNWSIVKYINGDKLLIDRPLWFITSTYKKDNNNFIVRQYNFDYEYDELTNKLFVSKLWQSVKQSEDEDGEKKDTANTILFDWKRLDLKSQEFKESLVNSNKANITLEEDFKVILGDFNGDGFPDKLLHKNYGDKVIFVKSLNNGEGKFNSENKSTIITTINTNAKAFTGDFDANGTTDVAFLAYDNVNFSLSTFSSDDGPNGFNLKTTKTLANIPGVDFKKVKYGVGDFNSDGYADIMIFFTEKDKLKYQIFTSSKEGIVINKLKEITKGEIPDDLYVSQITDINGDGISDLLFSWTNKQGWFSKSFIFKNSKQLGLLNSSPEANGLCNSCLPDYTMHRYPITTDSTGGNPVIHDQVISGDYSRLGNIMFADINKDGNTDIIISDTNKQGWNYYCAFGKGNGNFDIVGNPLKEICKIQFFFNHKASFGDFNGDGYLDLVIQKTDATGWYNLIAYGDGRGTFKLKNDSISEMNLLNKNNFTYSQIYKTKNVLPYCSSRNIPFNEVFEKGKLTIYDNCSNDVEVRHECWLKNIRLNFPVETGYFPNNVIRAYDVPMGNALEDYIPKNLSVENNIKRIIGAEYFGDSTIQECGSGKYKYYTKITYSDYWQPYVLDLNGDGLSDILLTYPRQVPSDSLAKLPNNELENKLCTFTSINQNEKSYSVNQITHSNKNKILIMYTSILNNKDTTLKQNQLSYPYLAYNLPMYTVSRISMSNAAKLDSLQNTRYIYANGIYALNGRGFIGFQHSKLINESNNNYSLKEFWTKEDFMERGLLPLKRANTYIDGVKNWITDDAYEYELRVSDVNIFNIFNSKKISSTKDLDDVLTSHSENQSQYDMYGNLLFMQNKKGIQDQNEIIKEISNTYYEGKGNHWEENWLLGRLLSSTIKTVRDGQVSIRMSEFEYDNNTGQLIKEISDKQDKNFSLTKEYKLNKFGNVDTSIVYPTFNKTVSNTRVTITNYSKDNRFVIRTLDPEGYISTKETDLIQGLVVSTTFADIENVTKNTYDPLGTFRIISTPDSVISRKEMRICKIGEFSDIAAYYTIDTNNVSHLPVIIYYNSIDLVVRKVNYDHKQRKIVTEYEYDIDGNLIKESFPHFEERKGLYSFHFYDKLNRRIKTIFPDNSIFLNTYSGLITTTVNPKGQKSLSKKNILGELEESIDHLNYHIHYTYDLFGRITKITDKGNRVFIMEYDMNGNRTKYINPNFKNPEIALYDGFNNKISSIDPNGYPKTFLYDKINRLIALKADRINFHEQIIYTYINQNEKAILGKGKIKNIQSFSDDHPINEEFTYFANGNLKTHTYKYDQKYNRFYSGVKNRDNLEYSYTYEKNLLKSINYPYTGHVRDKRFTLNYEYNNGTLVNAYGILDNKVKKNFWQLIDNNSLGQITSYKLGDSTLATQTYDTITNNIVKIQYQNSTELLAGMNYAYDKIGNLVFRQDLKNIFLADSIDYDSLNRVSSVNTNGYLTKVSYFDNGDIKQKIYGAQYQIDFAYLNASNQYNSIKLTDIKSKKTTSFSNLFYDSYGNQLFNLPFLVSSSKAKISYNQYNLPYNINNVRFFYAFSGEKNLISNESNTGTVFLSNLSELNYDNNQFRSQKINIVVNNKVVAYYFTDKDETNFLLKDALNTVINICNDKGKSIGSFAYDIWGLKRNIADWKYNFKQNTSSLPSSNSRGFLNCLSFNDFGLIDFNARQYDPITGRFISVDPIVDSKYSLTQFINSYAYGYNNPTVFVDSNGRFAWFVAAIIVAAFVGASATGGSILPWEWNENWWKGALVGALSVAGGYGGAAAFAGGGIGTAIASGAAAGFTAGFTSTIVNGGNFSQALESGFKGGIIGGITAGVTFGIGDAFFSLPNTTENYFAKAAIHGLNQGIASEALGGSFEHGFLAGSFTSLSTPLSQISQASPETKVFISAMVGGTASALGGGKFANGALSGAMIQIYNENSNHEASSSISRFKFKFSTKDESLTLEGGPQFGNFLSVDDEGGVQLLWGQGFRYGASTNFTRPELTFSGGFGVGAQYVLSADIGANVGSNNGFYLQGTYIGVGYQMKANFSFDNFINHPNSVVRQYYFEFSNYILRGTGY